MDMSSNQRWIGYGGLLASIAVVAFVLLAFGGAARAADAAPTTPASGNWNFERGDLTSWQTRSTGSGAWHVYADGTTPPDPADTDPNVAFRVPEPPEGRFAAVTDMQAPGTRILYRDVKLDRRAKLRFTLFYVNGAGVFSPRSSLDHTLRRPNQQFRVDLMEPRAPVDSLAPAHVLARIFQTAPGDPDEIRPRKIAFDLSRWAGKTVRIRFAQVDNIGPLRAGVDDVRLEAIRG